MTISYAKKVIATALLGFAGYGAMAQSPLETAEQAAGLGTINSVAGGNQIGYFGKFIDYRQTVNDPKFKVDTTGAHLKEDIRSFAGPRGTTLSVVFLKPDTLQDVNGGQYIVEETNVIATQPGQKLIEGNSVLLQKTFKRNSTTILSLDRALIGRYNNVSGQKYKLHAKIGDQSAFLETVGNMYGEMDNRVADPFNNIRNAIDDHDPDAVIAIVNQQNNAVTHSQQTEQFKNASEHIVSVVSNIAAAKENTIASKISSNPTKIGYDQ